MFVLSEWRSLYKKALISVLGMRALSKVIKFYSILALLIIVTIFCEIYYTSGHIGLIVGTIGLILMLTSTTLLILCVLAHKKAYNDIKNLSKFEHMHHGSSGSRKDLYDMLLDLYKE